MDQPHLGQSTWEPPRVNSMPAVSEVLPADTDDYGVAIEGDAQRLARSLRRRRAAGLRFLQPAALLSRGLRRGDTADRLHDRGRPAPGSCSARTRRPRLDRRFWVEIDWTKAPTGSSAGTITVKGKRGTSPSRSWRRRRRRSKASEASGPFRQPGRTDRHRRADCDSRK